MANEPAVCAIKTHRSGPRVRPPVGFVHCYDCGQDKGPEEFQVGCRGKPCSPCIRCRAIRLQKYVSDGKRPKSKTSYETIKAWSQRNPHKKAAHNAVAYALRRGTLQRMQCQCCGDPKTHAHHSDYAKRLDLEWLCDRCHKKEHRTYA